MKTGWARRKKERLFATQRGKCAYCKLPMFLDKAPYERSKESRSCTLEHVYPKGHPMRNLEHRFLAVCYECNAKAAAEWSEERQAWEEHKASIPGQPAMSETSN